MSLCPAEQKLAQFCRISQGKKGEIDTVGERMHYSQLSLAIYHMNKLYHPIFHAPHPQESMCLYVQNPV
jgi:hypothetical protein